MKLYKYSGLIFLFAFFSAITACEENTTTIGSSIATGEVDITIDTFYFDLSAKPIEIKSFDSKTGNLMIGNIQLKEYGNLNCSFVSSLMCAAALNVNDSLFSAERVDSCKLILGAERDEIIGDSLAPQRLTIYTLTKTLPSDITNTFDPEGYYDPSSPIASRSYTVSQIANSDSAFYENTYVELSVDLPTEFGKKIFTEYKENPEIFQWPQTMAEKFLPGIYVKSTFGKGCIANITSAYVAVFYHSLVESTTISGSDTIKTQKPVPYVTYPFTVSPEVISSNNITYTPSENIVNWNNEENGEIIITTPGGYIAEFNFPAQALIDRYEEKDTHLSTVNDLLLYIPASSYAEDVNLSVAKTLLMVKKSEYEEFFQKNKTPDNLSSFTGVYDSEKERYYFTTLRNYFIELLEKETIEPEDVQFVLVPVEIETETNNSYYGPGTTYVTKCVPYTSKPTMTLLKTKDAMVTFSFSTQMID